MANGIIRDGVKYTCLKSIAFDENDECIEQENEITESDIQTCLNTDRENQELDEYLAQLEREEYQVHHLTPEEKKALKKAKSII